MAKNKNVEDVYRLSELQETLLVHRLQRIGTGAADDHATSPDATSHAGPSDAGCLVMEADLRGELCPERFGQAWEQTLVRHPVLRSSIHWRDLPHPVQVVARTASMPIPVDDWRQQSAADQTARFAALREAEQARGIDLGRAPAMRARLIHLAGTEEAGANVRGAHWRFLWVAHHILLDGWSSAMVLDEVLTRYRSLAAGEAVALDGADPDTDVVSASPPRFRDYVAWSRAQRARKPMALGEVLAAGTPLVGSGWRGDAQLDEELIVRPEATADAVAAWARRHQVTASSLFLGCWGLTLAEYARQPLREQVAFGFTVSGRSVAFDGVESMVGMFANTMPLALAIESRQTLAAWFADVFAGQNASQPYEHRSLVQLFGDAGIALRRPPFDTLVTYANFHTSAGASDPNADDASGGLTLERFRGDVTSTFPLTLAIRPDAEKVGAGGGGNAGDSGFELVAHFDSGRFPRAEIEAVVERFASLVDGCVTAGVDGPQTVGDLLAATAGDLATDRRVRGPGAAEGDSTFVASGSSTGEGDGDIDNLIEAQLMRIWNDLITVQSFGLDDSFFAIGGNSLLVPQMIVRIRQDFGVELPLGLVTANATVRALADVIAGRVATPGSSAVGAGADAAENALRWRSLVAIRPQGDRTPLYLVHGLGGEVGWFYNLANYLDPDVPLYGLQAPPKPFSDLRAMASAYVTEVRAQQPKGPYRIGGYCVGGGVAYEMARQIREAGEQVAALVLIDSVPHAHVVGAARPVADRIGGRIRSLLAKPPREMVASVVDFGRRAVLRLTRLLGRRLAPGKEDAPLELADVLDMRTLPRVYHEASCAHFRAMRDYQPEPYSGDVWLFRSHDTRYGEDFGWGGLVQGKLAIERIEGRHVDVLKEPHVRGVGHKLSRALTALDAGSGGAAPEMDRRGRE